MLAFYINKLYIISKCIKVCEESHIAMKQSFWKQPIHLSTNNSVQLSVVIKRSKLCFHFLKMSRDGCDIDGFCTKSENSEWKDMWLCDKIHQDHSYATIF